MPQPSVTITRSPSGTVYAETELVLTVDISFSDPKRMDVNITLDIKWIRQKSDRSSKYIVNNTHITVSAVSGSEGSFKASLTYTHLLPFQIVESIGPLSLSSHHASIIR